MLRHADVHSPRPPRAPEGSPPPPPRGRDAPVDPRRARRRRRDPGSRDPGLRLVHRVRRHLPGRVRGAPRPPRTSRGWCYEVVEDSVLDGAVWVEPSFYAPHHRDRFGADEDIIDMVLDAAARRGRDSSASGVGLMVAADRTVDPADRGRPGPRSPPPAPTRAWSPSVSPTTRPSGRPSPSPTRSPVAKEAGPALGPARRRARRAGVGARRARHPGSRPAPARRPRRSRTPSS